MNNQRTSVDASNRNDILSRHLRGADDQTRDLPSRWAGGGTPGLYTLEIDRGNTLSDGSTLGIKWASPAPTTVPSLYDPTVTSSFVDGIGRATLRINGVSQGLVLVAHYTGNGSPLVLALIQNQVVLTSPATTSLPLVSDATQSVTLYVPQTP